MAMQVRGLWFPQALLWLWIVWAGLLGLVACQPWGSPASVVASPTVFWLPTWAAPTPTRGSHLPPLSLKIQQAALFFDDFASPSADWPQRSGPWGAMGYAGQGYRITVTLPQTDVWAILQRDLVEKDVLVQVDATPLSGSEYNSFGLICRYQDDANFYFFVVSSAGYYAIVKKQAGEQYQLTPERQFARKDVIRGGSQTNRVTAVCQGDQLRLYVNGVLLAQVEDPREALPAGRVGLMAGAFTDAGVVINFDNFLVLDSQWRE